MIPRHIAQIMDPPIEEIYKAVNRENEVISFGQGTPSFSPDPSLIENFWNEVKSNSLLNQYSPDFGLSSTRQIVSNFLSERSKSKIVRKNVILTSGANMAFFNLLATFSEPNDEVILLTPYYFNHLMALQILQVTPIEVNTDKNFLPVMNLIEDKITERTKAIVIINPNNPTGAVYEDRVIEELLAICEKYELLLICDETYSEFIHGENHIFHSYFRNLEKFIRIGSFSKIFGITGWRIGYIVLPNYLTKHFIKIQDTTTIAPPTVSQLFVEYLIKSGVNLISNYEENLIESRKIMLKSLEKSPYFEVVPTTGAFYFFAKLKYISHKNFALNLASQKNIIVLPGDVFGSDYKEYIRFSYANTDKNSVKKGFNVINKFIESQI